MLAAIAALDPEAVIHSGDLWDGYGASAWKADVTSHDNLAALLNANKFLVSQGNHETSGEVLGFTPPLVRNGSLTYTASIGNTFVAVLGYSPDPAYLGTALASQESAKATWRVVVSHKPIYSSGSHGADGNAAIETLCDQYQVDLYVAGHDHDYERTEQLRGGAVVDTSNHLKAGAGTVYMVTGGGGAPLYSKSNPVSVSHVFKSVNHLVDIEATSTVMTVRAATVDGTPIDTFTITR
jgi:2',3'-cyclic-nucleotide 2'-phosphodiesterase (5'-nucleotidase family)